HREFGTERNYVCPAQGFREHDSVWLARNNRVEVGIREAARKRVHANVKPRLAFLGRLQIVDDVITGLRFESRRDGIFEIENNDIRAASRRFLELLLAVARDEQKRTHVRPAAPS